MSRAAVMPPEAMIDLAYFHAAVGDLDTALVRAESEVFFPLHAIKVLAGTMELPPACRSSYREMVDECARVVESIGEVDLSETGAKWLAEAHENTDHWQEVPDPAWVEAAQQVIAQINTAEQNLLRELESARKRLVEGHPDGLMNWTKPTDYEITLLLDPGPARRVYEACGYENEPLRIRAGQYQRGSIENSTPDTWKNFPTGHPLHPVPKSYLAQCILDVIPWRLLPVIREIEVQVRFGSTYGIQFSNTVWAPHAKDADDKP